MRWAEGKNYIHMDYWIGCAYFISVGLGLCVRFAQSHCRFRNPVNYTKTAENKYNQSIIALLCVRRELLICGADRPLTFSKFNLICVTSFLL